MLGLFALASKYYKSYESNRLGFLAKKDSSIFVREYSPQFGDKNAKVFLIEFLDPECESCRQFYPQIKNLLKEFKGKVKLIVRYAPFHRNSKFIIKALEASRKQKKYWEALELLFKYQPNWGNHHNPQPNLIFKYLPEIGINIKKLKSDMNDPEIEKRIAQDILDLKQLNVRGTPAFFVNGKSPEKFGIEYLKKAIQREVSIAYD
ncbi:MAG: disulfide bond formation protein DsbA [Epsilonproteobacteria bacterium]|nr:MAG: disulfide bond formation protein DsbA [Campylobacterota bacterium]RLA66074.1 MAG: disulfide bond formation protein DsbA [Campylobacterota bacterium]